MSEQIVPLNLISSDVKTNDQVKYDQTPTNNRRSNNKTKSCCKSMTCHFCFVAIIMILGFILRLKLQYNKSNKQNQDKPNTLSPVLQRHFYLDLLIRTSKLKWKQHANTIAGGNGKGKELDQLNNPQGIYFNNQEQSIYIADSGNHRIVKWKLGENNGQIIAGGNGQGNKINQLSFPTNIIVDEKNKSLIICDFGNRRVVRWSLENQEYIQIIIEDIKCNGLKISEYGNLFVADVEKHAVKKWKENEQEGIIVAGGNGKGNQLNQLNYPTFIFVDQQEAVYVSDHNNHRVMKWLRGAKQGIIVADIYDNRNNSRKLFYPQGIFVSGFGNIYVVDSGNHQIMLWPSESRNGRVIVGENGHGKESNKLASPIGLSSDTNRNIYIADAGNNRIQRFEISRN